MLKFALVVGVVSLPINVARLDAQRLPQTREGFTIALGVGAGSGRLFCAVCASERHNGLTGFLRLGGAVRPNLILAGETRAWSHTEESEYAWFSYTLASVQWYPRPETGWYVSGGLGVGLTTLIDELSNDNLAANGLALMLGGGYDIRMKTNFSLTPFMAYVGSLKTNAKFNGTSSNEKLGGSVLQLGLGFTWH